jgi:hypothetical protein
MVYPLAAIVTATNVYDSKAALRLGVGKPRKRPLRFKGDKRLRF